MSAIVRFVKKHWKRLFVAALGTALAGSTAARVRSIVRATPIPPPADLPISIPDDAGPIVQQLTIAQRLRRAVPKKKRSGSGSTNGGGSSAAKNVPQTMRQHPHNVFEETIKKTPIPERPRTKSREVSEEAQRTRDTARETAKKLGYDGPDFGIGRRPSP